MVNTEEMMELRGKREICKHVKRRWKTVLEMKDHGFPLTQVGRSWVSDTEAIRDWNMKRLQRRSD
jgi:hypothetical protein